MIAIISKGCAELLEFVKVPIGYLLGWIYAIIPNYGWTIILFTLVTKLILLPLGLKQQKSMTKMQAMQPKLAALQEKYKNDKQKQSEETMKLYKQYGISPMGGCLPMLIQLPIIFALYRVLYRPITYMLHYSAERVGDLAYDLALKLGHTIDMKAPMAQIEIARGADLIDFSFLGLDLAANPNADGWITLAMIIPILAAVTTYFSSKITTMMNDKKKKSQTVEKKPQRILSPDQKTAPSGDTAQVGKTMTWMMPIMTLWFTSTFPAALGVYWIASNIFSIVQTLILNGYYSKKMELEIADTEAQIASKREARLANKKRKGKK